MPKASAPRETEGLGTREEAKDDIYIRIAKKAREDAERSSHEESEDEENDYGLETIRRYERGLVNQRFGEDEDTGLFDTRLYSLDGLARRSWFGWTHKMRLR